MPNVSVSVAGRNYTLACGAGDEDRVKALAADIDQEAQAIASKVSHVSEAKLILMAAMQIADRVGNTPTVGAEHTAALGQAPNVDLSGMMDESLVAAVLDEVSLELEAIAESVPLD